jgi:acylpyruvate hydrolase
MKLATLRTADGTVAVIVTATAAIEVAGIADVGALLRHDDWRSIATAADGASHPLSSIEPARWAPVVPRPGKILCVGLNYRNHILEMGHPLPEHPTYFAKYPEALVGPFDDIELSAASNAADWEGELAVILGRTARHVDEHQAARAIAGFAVINDVTMRDYQNRTLQWLQGKTFENTAPFGPFLVTSDEWMPGPRLTTAVDGESVQEASTGELVFTPARLISYFSDIATLNPGDEIATGTPSGVGHARTPPRYLTGGMRLETSIDGLGSQSNRVVAAV